MPCNAYRSLAWLVGEMARWRSDSVEVGMVCSVGIGVGALSYLALLSFGSGGRADGWAGGVMTGSDSERRCGHVYQGMAARVGRANKDRKG